MNNIEKQLKKLAKGNKLKFETDCPFCKKRIEVKLANDKHKCQHCGKEFDVKKEIKT